MTEQSNPEQSILRSLSYYDTLRLAATGNVKRPENSNVDIFPTPGIADTALCHLSGLFPFTTGDNIPWEPAFEGSAAVALAAQHLNVGDGRISPEVEGLNDRCNIRFTVEFADTKDQGSTAMDHVMDQVDRATGSYLRKPCAFIGAYRSSVSVPASIVTGLFGYPEVSGASTSSYLDRDDDHPLFARTIPSESQNAIPIVLYFRKELQLTRLAVLFVDDQYGNSYLRSLIRAANTYTPDMTIEPISLGEEEEDLEGAIKTFKSSQNRFAFCLALSRNDDLMVEAYKQGVAGNGKHNWFFGDNFAGSLIDRTFSRDSPLHLAYRGIGVFETVGGVDGMTGHDNFTAALSQLRNSDDLQYLSSLFPENPDYGSIPPFVDDDDFLQSPLKGTFSSFFYDATIALGLAACNAISSESTLNGTAHYDALLLESFTGASGDVSFDATTGTRDAADVTYRLVNFIPGSGEGCVSCVQFQPSTTDVYQNATWKQLRDFIFNDGSSSLPTVVPPPVYHSSSSHVAEIVVPLCVAAVALAAALVLVHALKKRRKNQVDTTWYIEKQDLVFEAPPKVVGKGEYGYVLQAEYRGMDVVVKRIMPPKKKIKKHKRRRQEQSTWHDSLNESVDSFEGSASTMDEEYITMGMKPVSDNGRYARRLSMTGSRPGDVSSTRSMGNGVKKNLVSSLTARNKKIEQFMEEMQHLAKLRHPCIATVMGAIIEPGIEPMLVMEYMNHGSLYNLLHNETMFLESNTFLNILWDIAQGMNFLHTVTPVVIHGDLKAGNVLMDRGFRAKVADFGLKGSGCTGTPYWMAPEILRSESKNGTATDVYAFGIILYEVYSRRDPYEGEDPAKVLNQVADKFVQKRPPAPDNMPPHIQSLMADCLQDDADQRPVSEEIELRLKRLNANNIRVEPELSRSLPAGGLGASTISLSDIFPSHIAEALKEGRPVEPEHRDEVTIFFSDIVGFTDISAELPARKVAQMLNRLYTKFDALSRKHDIFKVETIGDAYMAVTNLVKDQSSDHAKRIAQFAIEAIAAANETFVDDEDPKKGFVNIRVGFHSGPVVADVVGTRNLRYTLFGDTVNTASRMESNSKANRIHCSTASADLLVKQCPEVPLRPRGLTAIKGKGEMHTFWVNEMTCAMPTKQQIEEKVKLEKEESIIDWASNHDSTSSKRTNDFRTAFQSNGGSRGLSFRFGNSSRSLGRRKRLTSDELIDQLQELDKLDEEQSSLSSSDSTDELAIPTPVRSGGRKIVDL